MSEYAKKINVLEKRLAILDTQLKEAKQWCQDTLKKLETLSAKHKQMREKWNL